MLNCDENAIIQGKRNELYSAISNLIINAAKYTPPKGTIRVTTRFADDRFLVEIKDNGVGIEAHHLPRLTERFYRVDGSRSTDSGGTGLGLAIVKHILMRHEGELMIDSEYGKGSCFTCAFPTTRITRTDCYEGTANLEGSEAATPDASDSNANVH